MIYKQPLLQQVWLMLLVLGFASSVVFIQNVQAHYSRFLEAFLRNARTETELDVTIHVPGVGTLNITEASCFNFEATDIAVSKKDYPDRNETVGLAVVRNLGMTCEMDAMLNQKRLLTILVDIRNAEWGSSVKYSFAGAHVQNISLVDCTADFAFTKRSLKIEGLGKVTTEMLEAIFGSFSNIIGPYVVDPIICSGLAFVVESMNVVLHLAYTAKRAVKVPRHIWPDVKLLERMVQPLSQNSSLLLAPYTESLFIELISTGVSDLLGARPKGSAKTSQETVLNRVIREKLSNDHTGTLLLNLCCDETGHGTRLVDFNLLEVPVSLLVTKLSLTNMDTFRTVDLLRASSRLTLNHTLELDGPIEFIVGFQLLLSPEHDEDAIVTLEFRGVLGGPIHLDALTLVAMDHDSLMENGNFENIFTCLMSSLSAVQVPRISLKFDMTTSWFPRVAGLDDDPLSVIAQSLVDTYIRPLIKGVTSTDIDEWMHICAWYVSPLLSRQVREYAQCPLPSKHGFPPPIPVNGFIDMTRFPMTFIDFFLNTFLGPSDPDFSIARVGEIVASVLSTPIANRQRMDIPEDVEFTSALRPQPHNKKIRRPQDGFLVRDDTLRLGPFSLLHAFPSLKGTDNESDPSVALMIGNVTVGPFNDIESSALLRSNATQGPYFTRNELVMNVRKKFTVSFDFAMSVVGLLRGGEVMAPAFSLDLELESVHVLVGIFAKINPGAVLHLTISQLLSSCFAFVFPASNTSALDDLAVDVTGLSFNVRCNHQQKEVDKSKGTCQLPFTQSFVDHISTPESNKALLSFMRRVIPHLAHVLSGKDNSLFDGLNVPHGTDQLMTDLRHICVGIPRPAIHTVEKPKWIPPMRYFMLLAALGMTVYFGAYMYIVHRRHRSIRRTQSGRLLQSPILSVVAGSHQRPLAIPSSALAEPLLNTQQLDETLTDIHLQEEEEGTVADIGLVSTREDLERLHRSPLARLIRTSSISSRHVRTLLFGLAATPDDAGGQNLQDALYLLGLSKSLVRHPGLHPFVRCGVTLSLLINFIIFVAGVCFFTMGGISIFSQLGQEKLKEIPMMTLTLDACIDMMVEARALLFALFIGGSSGIFPWIRVAMLAFVWLAPPTILPVEKRGRLVESLERLGKWCLAEVYLFTVLITVVNVQMTNPSRWEFLPPDTFKVDIECMPKWGLFAFLLATWISLFVNHAIVHFHRQAVRKDLGSLPSPPLANDHERQSLQLARGRYPMLISALLLLWPVCLVCALLIDTLSVRFLGVSGFGMNMLKASDKSSTFSVSLSSIFPLLLKSDPSGSENKFGLFLICFGYACFVLIAPVCLCFVSLAVWVVPLQKRHQVHALNTLRVLSAWSAIEVLMCTLVVIVLQLHTFFKAMSGTITFLPNWLGPVLLEFGASDDEATGFGVKAELEWPGFFWVVAASVVGNLCAALVYSAVENAQIGKHVVSSVQPTT